LQEAVGSIDENRYYLDDGGGILAIIQAIIAEDLALLDRP
jgi:hypothetical protein